MSFTFDDQWYAVQVSDTTMMSKELMLVQKIQKTISKFHKIDN